MDVCQEFGVMYFLVPFDAFLSPFQTTQYGQAEKEGRGVKGQRTTAPIEVTTNGGAGPLIGLLNNSNTFFQCLPPSGNFL